jgi:hypothetical protein
MRMVVAYRIVPEDQIRVLRVRFQESDIKKRLKRLADIISHLILGRRSDRRFVLLKFALPPVIVGDCALMQFGVPAAAATTTSLYYFLTTTASVVNAASVKYPSGAAR